MFWIFNFIFSFLASLFFCVIFDAPRKLYFACGFVGACGWMVYTVLFNGF
ncbi:MAG: threonine/serine exporter family protein, partial [Staphylococcus epidermidis]|nr:threonine/serine exporter family protein [Staphylococcus epidermidis]MDU1925607.1 threonine/serine exporter family protein [Staphylococcus epidermidis]MDU2625103.1 threonine/serine exporter family protein [Staphylococcus epidermidis]MDU3083330.1 threonine/serine exporter family protein [Staphylococcus epidermidis]MDU7925162.1 threonine/serine exporter family protein [Staphylococcus epidermidis]